MNLHLPTIQDASAGVTIAATLAVVIRHIVTRVKRRNPTALPDRPKKRRQTVSITWERSDEES